MQAYVVYFKRTNESPRESGVMVEGKDHNRIITRDGETLVEIWNFWPQYWAGAFQLPNEEVLETGGNMA